jgi:precorrin-6B C5,15-methyltransferase / cobalt-precorrin-6B C5,C15-methyltransferase
VGRLAVVGVGLEGPVSASPRGRRLLAAAERVIGADRHLAEVVPGPAEALRWDGRLTSLSTLMAGRDASRTVLLASGDPNLFGIGATLLAAHGPEAVDIEPSVSSLALALARSGVPSAGASLVSAHGRSLGAAAAGVAAARRAAVLCDPRQGPAELAAALLAAGVEGSARLTVAERLGGPHERVRTGTVAEPPPPPHDPLSVVVVERAAARGPGIGRDEAEYEHDAGMVTKAEVRAIALAALDPAADDVVWDLGCASGSVAIEAARLAWRGAVYAVERRPERAEQARRNAARHGAWNVEVLEADAREAVGTLPAPDAVFLGGGGADVAELAGVCLVRLGDRPVAVPGRLVACLATLPSVLELTDRLRRAGIDFRVAQVQVSRGRELAGRLGWDAQNPVHLVAATVVRA